MARTSMPKAHLEQQRLLEGWLLLAQEANERYGWDLGARALEALISGAAPQLERAGSALAAHAILWSTYQRQHTNEHKHDKPGWRRHQTELLADLPAPPAAGARPAARAGYRRRARGRDQ